jgi:hypothetical protein
MGYRLSPLPGLHLGIGSSYPMACAMGYRLPPLPGLNLGRKSWIPRRMGLAP